jgi:hypothetical protein
MAHQVKGSQHVQKRASASLAFNFPEWKPNKKYIKNDLFIVNNDEYLVKTDHLSPAVFNSALPEIKKTATTLPSIRNDIRTPTIAVTSELVSEKGIADRIKQALTNTTQTVTDIAARDLIATPDTTLIYHVTDATADPSVNANWSKYTWNGTAWVKYLSYDQLLAVQTSLLDTWVAPLDPDYDTYGNTSMRQIIAILNSSKAWKDTSGSQQALPGNNIRIGDGHNITLINAGTDNGLPIRIVPNSDWANIPTIITTDPAWTVSGQPSSGTQEVVYLANSVTKVFQAKLTLPKTIQVFTPANPAELAALTGMNAGDTAFQTAPAAEYTFDGNNWVPSPAGSLLTLTDVTGQAAANTLDKIYGLKSDGTINFAMTEVPSGLVKKGVLTSDADDGEGIYTIDPSAASFDLTMPISSGTQDRRWLVPISAQIAPTFFGSTAQGNTNGSGLNAQNAERFQSFDLTGVDGALQSLELGLSNNSGSTAQYTVKIYDGAGIGGALLETIIVADPVSAASNQNVVTVPSIVHPVLAIGNTYTVSVVRTGAGSTGTLLWNAVTTDIFPGYTVSNGIVGANDARMVLNFPPLSGTANVATLKVPVGESLNGTAGGTLELNNPTLVIDNGTGLWVTTSSTTLKGTLHAADTSVSKVTAGTYNIVADGTGGHVLTEAQASKLETLSDVKDQATSKEANKSYNLKWDGIDKWAMVKSDKLRLAPVATLADIAAITNPDDFSLILSEETCTEYRFTVGAINGAFADANATGFWSTESVINRKGGAKPKLVINRVLTTALPFLSKYDEPPLNENISRLITKFANGGATASYIGANLDTASASSPVGGRAFFSKTINVTQPGLFDKPNQTATISFTISNLVSDQSVGSSRARAFNGVTFTNGNPSPFISDGRYSYEFTFTEQTQPDGFIRIGVGNTGAATAVGSFDMTDIMLENTTGMGAFHTAYRSNFHTNETHAAAQTIDADNKEVDGVGVPLTTNVSKDYSVIVVGDSYSNGSTDYPNYLVTDRSFICKSIGVGGFKLVGEIEGLLTTILAHADTPTQSKVIIQGGINDIYGASTIAQMQASVESMILEISVAGHTPVLTAVPSTSDIFTDSAKRDKLFKWNNVIKKLARKNRLSVIDLNTLFNDPSHTGRINKDYVSGSYDAIDNYTSTGDIVHVTGETNRSVVAPYVEAILTGSKGLTQITSIDIDPKTLKITSEGKLSVVQKDEPAQATSTPSTQAFLVADWSVAGELVITKVQHGTGVGFKHVSVFDASGKSTQVSHTIDAATGDITLGEAGVAGFDGSVYISA